MERTKRINNILKKHLTDFTIEIVDNSSFHKGHNNFKGYGETHLKLTLIKNSKNKINRLKIHKFINFLLEKEFKKGLHALEINITQ